MAKLKWFQVEKKEEEAISIIEEADFGFTD